MVNKFQGRHDTLAYATGAITFDSSTELNDETFTANIPEVKDITVTPPSQTVEQVPLLGTQTQGLGANHRTHGTTTAVVAGTFQNVFMNRSNFSNWRMEGTIVMTGDEQFVDILGLGSGTSIGSATRYAVGNLSSNDWAKNMLGSMRAFLNNGSEEHKLVMTNVEMTIGPIKPTSADGHFERDFTAECLPNHGAWEFLD